MATIKIDGFVNINGGDPETLENIRKAALFLMSEQFTKLQENPPLSESYRKSRSKILKECNKPGYVGPRNPSLCPKIEWQICCEELKQ